MKHLNFFVPYPIHLNVNMRVLKATISIKWSNLIFRRFSFSLTRLIYFYKYYKFYLEYFEIIDNFSTFFFCQLTHKILKLSLKKIYCKICFMLHITKQNVLTDVPQVDLKCDTIKLQNKLFSYGIYKHIMRKCFGKFFRTKFFCCKQYEGFFRPFIF